MCTRRSKKGAKIIGLAQGGAVVEFLKKNTAPVYVFDPKNNPCGQPRIGGGYLLFGHMGLLKALGFLQITNEEVSEAIAFARTVGQKYSGEITTDQNISKQLALTLKDKHPFLVTSEFLRGFGNAFANQINETAKMISDYRHIPELNHHMLEGLTFPESLHINGLFVFFNPNFIVRQYKNDT